MTEDRSETLGGSVDRLRRLVDCCDRFEAARTAGLSPNPDAFRSEVSETEWTAALGELEALRRTCGPAEGGDAAPGDVGARAPSGEATDVWTGRGRADDPARGPDFVNLPAGTRIGDCEVLARIGVGGMGVVYRARQLSAKIDRRVALKLIRAGGPGEEARLRFANETLAAGRLAHENIVPLLEVGEWRGRPYYTMPLVEGTSLAALLREGPLPGDRAARILAPAARAVGHAHAGRVLHRDLKPANILLDGRDRPFVTDFGLAKLLESDESLTLTGQVLGSVPYMSPEQASDPSGVREAGDIYGLGATLYEMLTGRPPFRASEPAETMRQLKHDPPVPPRRLNPAISKDLETICLKCLEKEPARRYASASDLADELGRVLDGRPIRARPISPAGRALRWARRHPGVAALLMGLFLVASAGFLSTAAQLRQTRRALARLERRSYYDQIDLAAQALAAGRFEIAGGQLARTSEALRGWEYHYLARLASSRASTSTAPAPPIPAQPGGLYGVAFGPGGGRFATGGRLAGVRIWDAGGGSPPVELAEVPAGSYVDDIRWTRGPLVNHLAAGTRDGAVHLWDESGGKFSGYRSATHHKGAVTHLGFDPAGTGLATAGEDGRVLIVDVATGAGRRAIRERGAPVRSIAFHPRGEWLAVAGDDREVSLHEPSGRGRARALGTFAQSVGAVAFSRDGRLLAAGDGGGTIRIWDLVAGDPPTTLPARFDGVNALEFTPDGARLASAGADGVVRIWDHAAGREVLKLAGHADQVDALCFRPDGRQLLSVDVGGGSMLWDATRWEQPPPPGPADLRGHSMLIAALAVSRDGESLASAGFDEEILVWDVPGRRVRARLRGHSGRVNGLAFDSTGRRLASAGRDGTLRIWDLDAGRQAARYDSGGDRLSCVAFSPRERRVAFSGARGRVLLWDCDPGHAPSPVGTHRDEVYAVAYHPDGRRLATAGVEGVIWLWDADLGARVDAFEGHSKPVDGLAFSPDGTRLASASHDRTLRILELATRRSEVLAGHDGRVWRVAFSGDGRLLASAASDGSVRVWDAATGRQSALLLGHSSSVYGVAFDPRGRFLASAGGDLLVKLWDPEAWDPAAR